MMNRLVSQVQPALFGAGIALLIVVLALVGLARLTPEQPTSSAVAPATPAGLTAGTVAFDAAAVTAERRRDVVGALLMAFAVVGAVAGLACAAWACIAAWRAVRAGSGEPAEGREEGTASGRGLAGGG